MGPQKFSGVRKIIYEKVHTPTSKKERFDVDAYLAKRRTIWIKILASYLRKHKRIKFDTKLTVKLQKRQEDNVYIFCNPCFRTDSCTILSADEIEESVLSRIGKMVDSYDIFMKQGSGWILNRITESRLNVYEYSPPYGGGVAKRTKSQKNLLLPPQYSRIQNKSLLFLEPTPDNKCFLYCVLAALFPPTNFRNKRKISSYLPFVSKVNTSNLTYPVDITQIPRFEKNNALCINVFSSDSKGHLNFIYHSKTKNYKKRINLLLYKNHFTLILKWSCFLNFTNKAVRSLCQNCGTFFKPSSSRKSNSCVNCSRQECEAENNKYKDLKLNLEFKSEGEKIRFVNFRNMKRAPFIIYSDIETMSENVPAEKRTSGSKTKKKQRHKPISIGYLRVCTNEKYSQKKPKIFTGEACIEEFFSSLEEEIEYMENIIGSVNEPLHMSEKQKEHHLQNENCYVCGIYLRPGEKYKDHDHLQPKNNYLGVICNSCNLNRTDNKNQKTTLVFHAGGKFDINFLIQKIYSRKLDVTRVVGKTGEQIMSMCLFKNKMLVIDSINHLTSSLANLVDVLKKSNRPFINTENYAGEDKEGLKLLYRKGVFPYSFLDSLEKLETDTLPQAASFFDSLHDVHVSKEDYAHATKVWNHFECANLKDYMELYLSLDITLLADVFENYRRFFFEQFGLEVSRYLSLPGLSYDCMLKFTGSEIDYVYQKDVYDFLKRGIRGGISMIPQRAFQANNPLLSNFDPKKEIWYIIYIDANGLYSSIMNLKLPYKNLRWVDPDTIDSDKLERMIETYRNEDEIGYFLEVDLEYPDEIKEKTKDFPLAPEHRIVERDMLSPFSKMLQEKIGAKNDKVPKLLNTQYPKLNYVTHVENLQFYLEKGLRLTKVHKILRFEQKCYIKPYIEFCMTQRNRDETTPDERNMWKLASNAIFGKTIQNCEKMNLITFHTNEKKLLKKIASPRFKHADIINDKVAQVTSLKKRNCVNTPYFAGVAILELSKLFMMKVYYNIFLEKYGLQKMKLLLTDTDSLLLAIQTEDVYKDLEETRILEFGNFPKTHPYYRPEKTGKIFYFKDESCGCPIESFVGLRAKCYSIHYPEETLMKDKISAKGVNRSQIKKMTHGDMNKVLEKNEIVETTAQQIRSFKHQVFNVEQNKLSLSGMDTKRWISWDNASTLPFGHPFANEDVENYSGRNTLNYLKCKETDTQLTSSILTDNEVLEATGNSA